jgi:intracellular septation protein A
VTTSAGLHVIDMPGWRPIAKQVLTTLLMVSLLPMAVFYTTMTLFGVRAAALATVAIYYAGLVWKFARGKPVLTAALLTAGLLSLRTVTVLLTGSAFVYFLQPVAGTVVVATVIATTALAGRPILDRLAHEFCPFPEELSERLREARFFTRLSAVWTATYIVNAVGTVWLLTNASLGGFILLKSALSPAVTATAVLASYAVFRLTIRGQNVRLRWAHHQPWAPASA